MSDLSTGEFDALAAELALGLDGEDRAQALRLSLTDRGFYHGGLDL